MALTLMGKTIMLGVEASDNIDVQAKFRNDVTDHSREWARASARNLARRLRRRWRDEIGQTRAAALAYRTKKLRQALSDHWALTDALGAHYPAISDALHAARVLGIPVDPDLSSSRDAGNWARHSPPPGVPLAPACPAPALRAEALESFRAGLLVSLPLATGPSTSPPGLGACRDGDFAGLAAAGLLHIQAWWRRLLRRRERQVTEYVAARSAAHILLRRCYERHVIASRRVVRAADAATQAPQSARLLPLCRYADACPFHRIGRCRFRHGKVPICATAGGSSLADSFTLPHGQQGSGLPQLLSRWAASANPDLLVIHDPYLAALQHRSDAFPACEAMDGEALRDLAARIGLARCTDLQLVDEAIQIVSDNAPARPSAPPHASFPARDGCSVRRPFAAVGGLLRRPLAGSWHPAGLGH